MATLSPNEKARLKEAIFGRGEVRARLALQHVQILDRATNDLLVHARDTHPDTQTVFWIRLHGVLVEIGGFYESTGDLIGPMLVRPGTTAAHALNVRDTIRAIRDALDEDERIWLHYRRDTECHVWPESYELGVRNGKLKENRRFALIDQTIHVDEFDRRARAFLRKYNVNEPAIAAAFAKKLAPLISKLLVAMRPLYEQ
jgi:hypothetical protein